MPTLTVKNLDPKVHEALKREASREQRSLNSFLVMLLEQGMEERRRRARMRAHREELERLVRELPTTTDSVELIRQDRETR